MSEPIEPTAVFARPGATSFGDAPTLYFIGSSTIALWDDLADDFSLETVQRGIGGYTLARMADEWSARFAADVPGPDGAVILYNGENDIAFGADVSTVVNNYEEVRDLLGDGAGTPPLIWLDVKNSPSRSGLRDEFEALNDAVAALTGPAAPDAIVDTNRVALDAAGAIDPSKFADGLHFDAAAYDELAALITDELTDLGVGGDGAGGVVTVDHNPSLELDAGTIALRFNADRVDGTQGLVSKDASEFGAGGHLSIYLRDGVLGARFQDEQASRTFTQGGIVAGRDYEVVASFDETGGVKFFVDGALVGEDPTFATSWADNTEFLHVGGLGWRSSPGSEATTDPFDGTVDDVAIFDAALTPATLPGTEGDWLI